MDQFIKPNIIILNQDLIGCECLDVGYFLTDYVSHPHFITKFHGTSEFLHANHIPRADDFIRTITAVDCDTTFTLVGGGVTITSFDLNKNISVSLNLPVRACIFHALRFDTKPNTKIAYTFVNIFEKDITKRLDKMILVEPDHGYFVREGMIGRCPEDFFPVGKNIKG